MTTTNKAKAIGFTLAAVLMAVPVVKHFEGEVLVTYLDPVSIPTVCVGETDKQIVLMKQLTSEQCTAVLGASLMAHGQDMAQCIDKPLKPHEAAAVLSWGFNVGADKACKSTLVRRINAGETGLQWCPELKRWDKAGGKVLKGLTRRREAEYQMCIGKR
jgi:lysozyme